MIGGQAITTSEQVSERLLAVRRGQGDADHVAEAIASDLGNVERLAEALSQEMAIGELERLEGVCKRVYAMLCHDPSDASAAAVARFQLRLGFLCKTKSYAIKCASPLGFAVFLQREGRGFSFQRHVEHKAEIFHIIEPRRGARVFLCSSEQWSAVYDPQSFKCWLGGQNFPQYEQYSFVPSRGDVIVVDELHTVHTVFGCVLEEFATVSTDMVDRLHDQNAGEPIPQNFDRAFAEARLQRLAYPGESRVISTPQNESSPVASFEASSGVATRTFDESFVLARHHRLDARAVFHGQPSGRITSLFATSGAGTLEIGGQILHLETGHLVTVLPNSAYEVTAGAQSGLAISEHGIDPEIAFTVRADNF